MKTFNQCPCCGHVSEVRKVMVGNLLSQYIGRGKPFSMIEVAHKLGISKQAIHYWIQNKISPSEDNFRKVVKLLRIPEETLNEYMEANG